MVARRQSPSPPSTARIEQDSNFEGRVDEPRVDPRSSRTSAPSSSDLSGADPRSSHVLAEYSPIARLAVDAGSTRLERQVCTPGLGRLSRVRSVPPRCPVDAE